MGRAVAVFDRSAASFTTYDGRGRATKSDVAIARPVSGAYLDPLSNPTDKTPRAAAWPSIPSRYATDQWHQKSMVYDAADREVSATTGLDTTRAPELAGTDGNSGVQTVYSQRGTVKQVGSSYGSLVTSIDRRADGLHNEIVYGDAAQTTTAFSYDQRRRLSSVQTYRGPPASWSSPPPEYQPAPDGPPTTFQLLLQDEDFIYDVVNNPIEIRDWRNPDEWPAVAKPVTKKIQYDDLYRVTRVDYEYAAGDDTWVSPFDVEVNGSLEQQDLRRAQPSPHVSFDKRILRQTFKYDWLGNTEKPPTTRTASTIARLATSRMTPPAASPTN